MRVPGPESRVPGTAGEGETPTQTRCRTHPAPDGRTDARRAAARRCGAPARARSPAARLGGHARLEQAAADLWGQPRSIVAHAQASGGPERVHDHVDAPAASRERIDGVLDR